MKLFIWIKKNYKLIIFTIITILFLISLIIAWINDTNSWFFWIAIIIATLLGILFFILCKRWDLC